MFNTSDENVTLTWVGNNDTIDQVQKLFHINITSNLTDQSDEAQAKLFDLYEMYKTKEKEQLMVYRLVAYVLGTLIILSNLIVVISSGLIIKKGQQPKSTYLLLGNVSLADTIVGFSIIFGTIIDHSTSSNPICVFQIGMLVCPAMVSIFSVGLIAVDRYIYIIHGLYYQRWFSTTRVRIGILCIWLIGLTLGFLPATGWVNTELHVTKCSYVALFPGSIILLNSLISIVPILVVAVLYSIILVKALANVRQIRESQKSIKKSNSHIQKLRFYRRYREVDKSAICNSHSVKYPVKSNECKLKRSASFDNHYETKSANIKRNNSIDLTENISNPEPHYAKSNSNFSIISVSSSTIHNSTSSSTAQNSENDISLRPSLNKSSDQIVENKKSKVKKPNKWRAITVVMLTSGCFIITWLPFFIVVIFYILCKEKFTNPRCLHFGYLLRGPIATLAFINSVLNPLIYAWWHKGFKKTIKKYFQKYLSKCFSKR